jgi:hypothetical protein
MKKFALMGSSSKAQRTHSVMDRTGRGGVRSKQGL